MSLEYQQSSAGNAVGFVWKLICSKKKPWAPSTTYNIWTRWEHCSYNPRHSLILSVRPYWTISYFIVKMCSESDATTHMETVKNCCNFFCSTKKTWSDFKTWGCSYDTSAKIWKRWQTFSFVPLRSFYGFNLIVSLSQDVLIMWANFQHKSLGRFPNLEAKHQQNFSPFVLFLWIGRQP